MDILHKPLILATIALYGLFVVAVGVWALRRTAGPRDFFIAGQRLGLWVTGVATMSAAFSGFVFLGGPGLTYRLGLGSLFIVLPVGLTGGMLCWCVGKRLRLLAEVREVYTVPDALAARFGGRGPAGWAAVAVAVGSVGYLGAQFLALGRLLEVLLGGREALGPWSLALAMALGLAVVLFYSVAGGMVAGVYTDFFQGLLMLGAAGGVFYYALRSVGGWRSMTEAIAGSGSFGTGFLEPFGTLPVLAGLGFFFVFGVGTLGQPHMLHKFYMLKDPEKLRWLPLVLGASQALCVLIWLGIGLAVPALVATGELAPLATADDAAPLFLLSHTPQVLAGLVCAGILAAIMSTADSFVNIGSAALVRDLPRAFGRPLADEFRWGRRASVGVALLAGVVAYFYDDLIALLGTFAFGTFAAALVPALAVGLNWRRVTSRAATASIATGTVANLGLEGLSRYEVLPLAPGAMPSAVALAASFTVLFAVTLATPASESRPTLPPDLDRALSL
ncbi:MAG: hypothetical protein AAF481_18140 [Acidobacteriota bacterium]